MPLAAMRIALFQPDIPQNTGTILRLCACLDVEADIIEPAGFPVSDRHFRRAGMDYLDQVRIMRHLDWTAFESWRRAAGRRLLLFTTKGATRIWTGAISLRTFSCSGANRQASPTRCSRPPMSG